MSPAPLVEDDGALMMCHADALFLRNDDGDLTSINDFGREVAPAAYWGITLESSALHFRHDLPAEIRREIVASVKEVPDAWAAYTTVLERLSTRLVEHGLALSAVWSGPVFTFPNQLPRYSEPVHVTPLDAALLLVELPDHARKIETTQPCLAVVRDGRAVAVCCTARQGICVDAGVETAPAFRRMGLGTAICAEWVRAVRNLRQVPIYSTSWENVASRRLADRLRLRWIGVDVHFQLLTA